MSEACKLCTSEKGVSLGALQAAGDPLPKMLEKLRIRTGVGGIIYVGRDSRAFESPMGTVGQEVMKNCAKTPKRFGDKGENRFPWGGISIMIFFRSFSGGSCGPSGGSGRM